MNRIQIGEQFKTKYDYRETCFGLVEIDNKLLLVNKNNQYSLVGGGIEQNETKEECLKREFLEEAGYTITDIKELVCIDCYWLAANKYPMLSKANIYVVNIDIDSKQEPLEKGHEIEFIDVDLVKNLLPLPYHKKALEYYLNNKTTNKNIWGKKCACGNTAFDYFDEHVWNENIEKEVICNFCERKVVVKVEEAREYYISLIHDCFKEVKGNVLEIGCGGGLLTAYLSNKKEVNSLVAIDNDLSLEEKKYIESITNNYYDLNLNDFNENVFDKHFDYVVCKDVLMYLKDIDYTFSKLSKISDKVILLNWYNQEHKNCLNKTNPNDILKILRKYYKNIEIEYPEFHKWGYLIKNTDN